MTRGWRTVSLDLTDSVEDRVHVPFAFTRDLRSGSPDHEQSNDLPNSGQSNAGRCPALAGFCSMVGLT